MSERKVIAVVGATGAQGRGLVRTILSDPDGGFAGELATGEQMAAALTRALATPVRYRDIAPDLYRHLGFVGADDLGNMFQVKRDFETEYCGARDPDVARELNPALQTFEMWLDRNKSRIPLD